jgi:predicted enzyme related to lactoylglutathione lyase
MTSESDMTEHGSFHWNELNTRDPTGACDFYGKALGWTFDAMPMPDSTYYLAKVGDKIVGGIFEMTGPQFDGIPAHWFAYIAVDDVDARVAAATKLGAAIMRAPWDIAGVGRIAIVKDPTGAVVGWMTPA